MKRGTFVACLLVTFVVGIGVGTFGAKAKKPSVTPEMWSGKSPTEAANALLEIGAEFAGSDSWENIHLARVYYLMGDKDKAEAIFSRFNTEGSDVIRVARIYAHAGDWDKAKPLFDKLAAEHGDDADWLTEIGAFYNLNGDRERAEELFAKAFADAGRSLNNTLTAAGSYAGIEPRKR